MDKEDIFERALKEFENSNKNAEDYATLLTTFYSIIRPDTGLTWGRVYACLVKVIPNKSGQV